MASKQIEDLIIAGSMLSNIAYNIAQDEKVPKDWRSSCDTWRKRWDAELGKYRAQKKAKVRRGK